MKNLILFIFAFFCLFQSSCKKEDWIEPVPSEIPQKLEGVWESEGYGYLLHVQNGVARIFDRTAISCIPKEYFFDGASEEVHTWPVILKKNGKEFIYQSSNILTSLRFFRLAELPVLCAGGGTSPSDDANLNFDVLWQTFKEHYAFFKERNVDWEALRERFRPMVTQDNLQPVLQEMLYHFQEDHVTLITSGDDFINRFDAGAFRTFDLFNRETNNTLSQPELKAYVAGEYEKIVGNVLGNYLNGNFNFGANQLIFWGTLEHNIGYLLIGQFAGYSEEELKEALTEALNALKDTDGMIIDIRGNLGGFDQFALEAAGRFINENQLAWTVRARSKYHFTPPQKVMVQATGPIQYTKPLVILTSLATSSAAELFAIALQQRQDTKLVGETTNGIFSTMLDKTLPNGWRFTLSNERVAGPDGTIYEAVGIPVDIQIPLPNLSERNEGIDPALEHYMDWF